MTGIAGLALRHGQVPDATVLAKLARALAHRGAGAAPPHVSGGVGLAHGGPRTGGEDEPGGDGHAVVLHDAAPRRLLLARDPFGIRPLCIAEVPGGIAFASEPQALLAAGLVAPRLRMESVAELLQLRFTTGAETVFGGIRRVLPGETLLIADGAVVERHRRPALPEGGPEPITEADALTRLDAALAESVARQHRHGEAGLLLSGGIASCVLSRVLQRLGAGSVLALTATLDHPNAARERERAEAVARAASARHAVLTLTDGMVWRDLPNIVAAMDDPVAEEGIIPAWFLARRAREEGVGLVLSGAGGDALLAGDGRYRAATRPWWFGGRPMHGLGGFDRLPGLLREVPSGWRDGIAAAEVAAATPGRSRLQRAQAVDMAEWLPNALLARLDRCLAAHGVEGGAPFLDPGVVATAFRLPDALKQRGGTGMWLLRAWLAREAPGSQPFHRRRRFGLPLGAWIAGIGARLGPLVAAQPGVFEIAQPDRVEALFRDAARHRHAGVAAWRLLFYALWHRRHMEGRVPGAGQDTCDYLTG